MKKKNKRVSCEMFSPTYMEIINSKLNGTILSNGDTMIGSTLAICKKTNKMYLV